MSSDTIVQEVDEELRRDRMRSLWRRVGPFIIGGAVLVVLVVAGYEVWTWWQKNQSAESSDAFYAATTLAEGKDFDAARKALDQVIADGSGGYPTLARFREAALLAQNGKTDDAVAAYDALAASLHDTHLRELALILGANLLVDEGDTSGVQERVQGSITTNSPLRNAAREIMGLVDYKAGKLDDAMQTFQAILADPLASRDLRARVQIYVQQLVSEGVKPPPPPDQPATEPSAEPSTPAEPSAPVSFAPSKAP